jgi:hypothetical protein
MLRSLPTAKEFVAFSLLKICTCCMTVSESHSTFFCGQMPIPPEPLTLM